MVTMAVYSEVKRLYSSLQEMVGLRRRKPQKPPLHISEPFNFKRETTIPHGMPEDELAILREKAAASCLGLAPTDAALLALPFSRSHPHPHTHHRTSHLPAYLPPLSPSSSPTPLYHPSQQPPQNNNNNNNKKPHPRLSLPLPIPIPIPIPPSARRHAPSTLDPSSSSSLPLRGGTAPALSGADPDLLLFGNPSGVSLSLMTLSGGGSMIPMAVSPLGRGGGGVVGDRGEGGVSPRVEGAAAAGGKGENGEWDMEFWLGSPVSPLTPGAVV